MNGSLRPDVSAGPFPDEELSLRDWARHRPLVRPPIRAWMVGPGYIALWISYEAGLFSRANAFVSALVFIAIVFAGPPLLALAVYMFFRERRRHRLARQFTRIERGLCKLCAYDMALSKPLGIGPERCSECGAHWPLLLSRDEEDSVG